jgi:hypothetical protein
MGFGLIHEVNLDCALGDRIITRQDHIWDIAAHQAFLPERLLRPLVDMLVQIQPSCLSMECQE